MQPNYNVVKQLVAKHIEVMNVTCLMSGIGVHIDVLDNLSLLDIAMDLVGYPPDEVFNRDDVVDRLDYNLQSKDVEPITKKLFKELDHLILKKPELFVKTRASKK